MKKFLFVAAIFVAATTFLSCNFAGGDDDLTIDPAMNIAYVGEMVVYTDGEKTHSQSNTRFDICSADGRTLDLMMYQMKFDPAMPVTLNIVASAIPYVTDSEPMRYYTDGVVPTVSKVPMTAFKLQQLDIEIAKELRVTFSCKGSEVEYVGTLVK